MTWRGFLNNAPEDPAPLLERVDDAEPGHACTLIYTSGTTGTPKAVMISHDNVTWVVASFAAFVGFGKAPGGRERLVSYLPLSHIAAQAIDIYAGLVCTGRDGVQSSTLYFARPDALKGSLKDTLNAVRPTVFFGVPRVWEKFAEALQAVGAKTTGAKKKISTWAKRVALRRYLAGVAGAEPEDLGLVGGALSSVEEVFADLILKKVHAAIGLDKAHFVFTGAAPIATSTLEYFAVWKSKFYGAFVLNHRVVLHAIDATPARWRGVARSSPLDRARTAAPSPGNDSAPVALVDFHTGRGL